MAAGLRDALAAYKALLGPAADPQTPEEAERDRGAYFQQLRDSLSPGPSLANEVQAWPRSPAADLPRSRHLSISTGMRLRYLEWGRGGDETVLMLHDAGSGAEAWSPVAGPLAARGMRVLAVDMRGHGDSTWSSDRRYSLPVLAEDVLAFITALDLYTRPLALVGVGVGGAVAMAVAQQRPRLVGALAVVEFAPPIFEETGSAKDGKMPEQLEDDRRGGAPVEDGPGCSKSYEPGYRSPATRLPAWQRSRAGEAAASSTPANISASLLSAPWWGGYPGQGARFEGLVQLAALLGHPLSALGPHDAASCVAWMAAMREGGSTAEAEAARTNLQRTLTTPRAAVAAAAAAWTAVRLPPGAQPEELAANALAGPLDLRADPAWLFHFDPGAVLRRMPAVTAHIAVMVGARSGWVSGGEGAALARAATAAAAAGVVTLPGMGHRALPDGARALTAALQDFLEGPAMAALQRGSAVSRRPEVLGLKTLPRFDTLQDAQKALGPRPLPRPEAVEEALRKLDLENGEEPGSVGDAHQTALANNPSDYFGMVG
ncbi:hypothetical protein ACKKBF_B08730 [Auxenochlorella protothecoides x Auxenochlorella symbiontica]|uniref:AB hydrolase-1 domain-containing protein n=1 Tax=Auxenochlorella protothecoides TaxID=3075 RepID=A0A1D2ACJ2_AUXPR|nr:hypothetical protein APUTEX25_004419 [Auxenochlorella protothecoides]|eukprot:RMZ55995.1 hypothetical protein APUTEX25_004419 [Auxenochlorella protothecoides]